MARVLFLLVLLGICDGPFALYPSMARAEVVVVPIEGAVTKAQFLFLRRALKEAARDKAEAVILDMNTPGGELQVATEIMDALSATSIPTITYVNPNAGSAGSLISLSTDKIYMAPVSAIGAAGIVTGSGGDLGETMEDKMVSYYSKYFRSAAERNGYDPDIAEAFINKNLEIKRGDRVLSKEGSVLTLSAQEAVMKVKGKQVLATGLAESIDDILRAEKLAGPVKRLEPAGFEKLALWITQLAPLFLMGGIIGTYIEFKAPGFGVAGVIAALCFAIFFAGHLVAGLAGYEVVAVFFLGIVLVLVEVFVLPGVMVLGVSGAMLMLGALLWTMVDRYPGQPALPGPEMLLRPVLNLTIALGLSAVAIAVLASFLPKTRWFRHMTLQSVSGGPVDAEMVAEELAWNGREGVTATPLRPTGSAEFGGQLVDVVADGEFLEAGTAVRVVSRGAFRTVVERIR